MDELVSALGRLVWHVLPAFVIVGGGGFFINRFFVRKANLALLIDRVCGQLDLLAADCAEYWTKDQKSLKDGEASTLEARIKGRVLHIGSVVRLADGKYPAGKTNPTARLILDLQDRCTGGEFEVSTRKADRARYLHAVNVMNRLSTQMLSRKI
jgi:hypothetical protein